MLPNNSKLKFLILKRASGPKLHYYNGAKLTYIMITPEYKTKKETVSHQDTANLANRNDDAIQTPNNRKILIKPRKLKKKLLNLRQIINNVA